MINKAEIQKGDVFSESSHYVCIDPQALTFKHLESDPHSVIPGIALSEFQDRINELKGE